jgi:NAD(P)-dependent dehydrogenase (short-subunit alcohol dehydrogenase family)
VRVARTLAGGASLRRAVGGKTVMVAGPPTEAAEAVARRIGRAHAAVVRLDADLSDTLAAQTAMEDVLVRHGAVDALVVAPVSDGDEWQAMRSGYFGAVLLILAVLPGMLSSGHGQVVVLRDRGRRPAPQAGARGALDGFLACAAPELTGAGVSLTTVNVRPGTTAPDAVARAVAIALVHRPKRVDAR